MAELDGAMNPEAENMARERYEQEKIRLQVRERVRDKCKVMGNVLKCLVVIGYSYHA